jgi:hypothetical protein
MADEKEKEKKPGFWSKLKKDISDSNRESNIEHAYNDKATEVEVYVGNQVFNEKTYHGMFDAEKKTITVFGVVDIPYSSVLVKRPANPDKELPVFYYVVGCKHDDSIKVKATITENDKPVDYERPATLLTLDPQVEEIKVVKVKDTFFRLKEEPKKAEAPKAEEKPADKAAEKPAEAKTDEKKA